MNAPRRMMRLVVSDPIQRERYSCNHASSVIRDAVMGNNAARITHKISTIMRHAYKLTSLLLWCVMRDDV